MKTAREILDFISRESLFDTTFQGCVVEEDWSEEKLAEFLGEVQEANEPEETVTLTIGEIFERGVWEYCGINEWCLNEGRAEKNDRKTITKSQALKFMTECEFHDRKNTND